VFYSSDWNTHHGSALVEADMKNMKLRKEAVNGEDPLEVLGSTV